MSSDIAVHGLQAVQKVSERKSPYKLIFMDCMMPIMDGFEATQKIREMHGKEVCMIVALSAMAHYEDINKGVSCGMDEFCK